RGLPGVVRMQPHDRPLAPRAVEGRIAPGHATVVLLEGDEFRKSEAGAKRRRLEHAVHRGPEPPLPAVGTGHGFPERNPAALQLGLQRFQMDAGRRHARLRQMAPRVEIQDSGRAGSISYHEGLHTASFYWEFASPPALAFISGPKASEWD